VAFFPEWLASVMKLEKAKVFGPSGHTYTVDLNPQNVHTVVLWSKNFANLVYNNFGLRDEFRKYSQLYLHFTITGLGGSFIEQGVPDPTVALSQLKNLIEIVGNPQRVSVRFDPIIYWREDGREKTNLYFFEKLAPILHNKKIKDVRLSFTQWYNKAKRRAAKKGFAYIDPPFEKKVEDAKRLFQIAKSEGLDLHICSQASLSEASGIPPSSCIDGALLQKFHPDHAMVSTKKDRTQRKACLCTESVDIGSYTKFCPHSCLYCYANPKI
jgi:DNA repair photolyase